MTIEKLYTTDEVCEMLKVSRNTVQRMIEKGHLKETRIDGILRFKESDIKELIGQKDKPVKVMDIE